MNRKVLSVVATAVVAFGLIALPATTATAATTGRITVQLVAPSGHKLTLKAQQVTATAGNTVIHGVTNRAGKVVFALPAGSKQAFSATRTGYLAALSKLKTVKAGHTLGLKLKLTKGATLSGTVLKSTGGALSGAIVGAYTAAGKYVASGITNAKGAYKIVGLKSGSYHVQFNGKSFYDTTSSAVTDFTTAYWKNASGWSSSAVVTVHNQGKKSAASAIKRISSTVGTGHSILSSLSIANILSNGWVGLKGVNDATSSAAQLPDGLLTGVGFRVPAGDYKMWVTNGLSGALARTYWYTGGLLPSTNEADAQTIHFTGTADLSISMSSLFDIIPPVDLPPATVPPISTPPISVTIPPIVLPLITIPGIHLP
jgi:hypothetical protein